MNKKIIYAGYLFLAVSLLSCATLFGPTVHKLPVQSSPNGAVVYLDGVEVGKTPVRLKLDDVGDKKYYVVKIKKPGYKTITRTIKTKVGVTWIILDVLGGLMPVIVDAATGNWKELDDKVIDVELEQK